MQLYSKTKRYNWCPSLTLVSSTVWFGSVWFNLVLFSFWKGPSSQAAVNMSQRHQQFTLSIKFWHRLLLAIVTLIRSNWISGAQYFWAADRHQETLHSITYACRGKRTVSGEQGAHGGYIRLPQRPADPPVMNTGCWTGAALWRSLARPCAVMTQRGSEAT